MSRPTKLLLAAVALVLLFPFHAWKSYSNVNEAARIYLVQAMVRERVLNIDTGIERYGDVHDKAVKDGHFYCDKPIGLSLVAVPVYAAMVGAESLFGFEWSLAQTRYVLAVTCVGLPSLLLLLLLLRYWSTIAGDRGLVDVAVLAYALGTIACVYATQFMGHQLSAVLLVAHFLIARRADASTRAPVLFACGLLAGLGAITQYFSSLAHLVIAAAYLLPLRPLVRLWPFIVGGAIAFAPLPIYNTLCFGGPLEMGYGHEAVPEFAVQHGTGFFGVTHPTPESIYGLLVSPSKGLLFLSPFLVLGGVGIVLAWRDRTTRRDATVWGLIVAILTVLALSVLNWIAGWTVGPRHMVDMLPFLMTGVLVAVARRPALVPYFVSFAAVGIAFVTTTTLVFPAFEVNLENPVVSQTAFLLGRSHVSPNPLTWLGLPGFVSVLPPLLLVAVAFAAAAFEVDWGRVPQRRLHVATATLGAIGYVALVAANPPTSVAIQRHDQATVLEAIDATDEAEAALWAALDELPTPQMAGRVCPRLLQHAQGRQDLDAASRVADRWVAIDPGNAQARGTQAQLQRIRASRPPESTP